MNQQGRYGIGVYKSGGGWLYILPAPRGKGHYGGGLEETCEPGWAEMGIFRLYPLEKTLPPDQFSQGSKGQLSSMADE